MRPVCSSTRDLLSKVDQVRPVIEKYAPESEENRRVAHEIYDALLDHGFFGTLVPREFGGLQLHPANAYRVWEAIARIDSSTGWNSAG